MSNKKVREKKFIKKNLKEKKSRIFRKTIIKT